MSGAKEQQDHMRTRSGSRSSNASGEDNNKTVIDASSTQHARDKGRKQRDELNKALESVVKTHSQLSDSIEQLRPGASLAHGSSGTNGASATGVLQPGHSEAPKGPPFSTSTAIQTPTTNSPGTSQNVSLESTQYPTTPMGGGVNHRLSQFSADSPSIALPMRPSKEHANSAAATLKLRINFFQISYRNRKGWVGTLEADLKKFFTEIEELFIRCREMDYKDIQAQVEETWRTLEGISNEFRDTVGTQQHQDEMVGLHNPSNPHQ